MTNRGAEDDSFKMQQSYRIAKKDSGTQVSRNRCVRKIKNGLFY